MKAKLSIHEPRGKTAGLNSCGESRNSSRLFSVPLERFFKKPLDMLRLL